MMRWWHGALAATALATGAPGAAATWVVDVSGAIANLTTFSFGTPQNPFTAGQIKVALDTPFTVSAGDMVTVNFALDGPLPVPGGNQWQFVGINLDNDVQPQDGASVFGTMSFTDPVGVAASDTAGCGNCLSAIFFRPGGGAFSFTGASSSVLVQTLDTPFEVTGVSLSYQVSSVVPEPAAWALMIVGFGAVGAALRRRGSSMPRVLLS